MCGSLRIMDFKRFGPDGLLILAKYDQDLSNPEENISHKVPVSFRGKNNQKEIQEKVWVGHAQSEKLSFWESRGWQKGVLDGIHGYTERVHVKGKPTDKLAYLEVAGRRIAVLHKGNFCKIVTRAAKGKERFIAPRFPVIIQHSKK